MSRITPSEFVQQSLDINLFFLRIMKEHAFFLEAAFVAKNKDLIERADKLRLVFEELLEEAVKLADNNLSRVVLNSGEIVTDKTVQAEEKTEFLSGLPFNTRLTRREEMLRPGQGDPTLVKIVEDFNERAVNATKGLINLKTEILDGMLECKLFTWNFPQLIEHIRREARYYVDHLQGLQARKTMNPTQELISDKVFWDHIMAEHSLFIAHLLDPSEADLIKTSESFARKFFILENRAKAVKNRNLRIPKQLMRDELKATSEIREFKSTANNLILDCQIRSVIIPLLADHVLREANHFLGLLTNSKTR